MASGGLGRARTQIGRDHSRVARYFARAAARDLPALVKHHHTRRQRHDDFHDVLDNDQVNPGTIDVPHEIDSELHLALGETRVAPAATDVSGDLPRLAQSRLINVRMPPG